MLLAATITTSHAAVIKGTVTDTSNEPLIGATVRIENTTYTATTDIDGNFEIAGLRNGSYTLVAEYVFHTTQQRQVRLDRIATENFRLEAESHELSEVKGHLHSRRMGVCGQWRRTYHRARHCDSRRQKVDGLAHCGARRKDFRTRLRE